MTTESHPKAENETSERFRTKIANIIHPVSKEDIEVKQSYLKCIASIANADKVIEDLEDILLEDLTKSLNLRAEHLDTCIGFISRKSDLAHFEADILRLKQSGLSEICLCDMYLLAYFDGNFCEETEGSKINAFAEKFGVQAGTAEKLKSLSHAIYNENFDLNETRLPNDQHVLNWIQAFQVNPQSPQVISEIYPKIEVAGEEKDSIAEKGAAILDETISSYQKEVLSQLSKLESVAASFKEDNDEGIQRLIKTVYAEKEKVKDLRMTLAFVGVMKSGKSTTINAVVGSNILPNRFGAMTTLPTLLTHEKGFSEPQLIFNKTEPFNNAIASIKKVLKEQKKIPADFEGELYADTVKRILNNELKEIRKEYKGTNEIYSFMESINDIARIASDVRWQMANPLDEYSIISDFPEIKVEFAYLADRGSSCQGRLTIIDTPGPNEAGQGRLRGVVKSQLESASSIVCVVDPFQKDSEAQHEMKEWIQRAQEKSGVPVFILINKLDMMKSEERDINKLETMAQKFFPDVKDKNGVIHTVKGRTYCVSSLQALLSNQASRALAINGKIPDWANEPWSADFLEKAYGGDWKDDGCISEPSGKHLEKSVRMWTKSCMQKPLDEVVSTALKTAAPFCLGSALKLISGHADELKKQSSLRWKGLDKDLKKLEETIRDFNTTINKIENITSQSVSEKENAIRGVREKLLDVMTQIKNEALTAMRALADEENKKKSEAPKKKNNLLLGIYGFSLGRREAPVVRVYNEKEPIEFSSESDAHDFVSQIMEPLPKLIKKEINTASKDLKKEVNSRCEELGKRISDNIISCSSGLNDKMQKEFGISIEIERPDFPDIDLDIDIASNSLVSSKTETHVYYKRKLRTLFLYKHECSYQSTKYIINPKDVKKEIEATIEKVSKQSGEILGAFIEQTFKANIEVYLADVIRHINSLKASIQKSIEESKCSSEKKKEIQSRFKLIEEDSESLKKRSVKTLNQLQVLGGH